MSLTAGTRLGSYEIVSAIGAGGMGEVYRAKDTALDRQVAIKVLPASFAEDRDRVARFEREAKTLASLNHPNIAAIYGIESAGASRALVMELVEGDDLSVRIARGPMPLDEALPIAKQIAEALEAAHEQSIVHRDLKPANIKVRVDGTVKVLDFGLAKAMDPASASSSQVMNSPTLTAHATQMGTIIGTAAYMSPEQAKGRVVDKRADIWAFGVVLFEMLSGTRGYEAEDVSDTLAAVLTREVDWTKLPATTPARLDGLLRDCLVRDPKQRLRDMGEARRIIDQLITGKSSGSTTIIAPTSGISPAAPTTPAWRRVLPWALTVLAVATAVVVVRRAQSTPVTPALVTRATSSFAEVAGLIDVSRDGSKIVYTRAGGSGGFHLELRHIDQFDGQPLPGTDGGLSAVFSPNADWIVYSTGDGKIKKTQSIGGPSITLAEGSFTDGATWGDDDMIVYAGATGLLRLPASGGTPETLTTIAKDKNEARHTHPQVLPGTSQLLFTVVSAQGDPKFAILDMKTRAYAIVAPGGDNGRYAQSGHLLSGRGGTLFALPFDLSSQQATGSEAPVIEGVSAVGPSGGIADYAVSLGGLLVYAESGASAGTTLTWRDRKGAELPLPGQVARTWGTGSISPDGKRVANAIVADKGSDIWVLDLARGTPTRLTFGGNNDNPIWTRDGRSIVYGGNPDGKAGLYRVTADGSGKPQLVLSGLGLVPSSFTPEDTALVYGRPNGPGGKPQIMVLPLRPAGEPRPFREGVAADIGGRVSPDGHWLAFLSAETGRGELYVMPFPGPGPKIQVSTNGASRTYWSPTGRELFFWDAAGGDSTLMSVAVQLSPFSSAPPQKLFTMFSGTTWGVAPDGQHFLVETVPAGSKFATVTNWFDELRRRAPVKK